MAVIEKVNPMPLYLQLKNQIKKEIRTGLLKAGDKLPSEAQLQKEYGMSRVTVRNAMEELAAEGYIIKVQGKGSLKRVRKADGVPVTVEENHLPPELVTLEEEDLTGSLYDILINKYHMVPSNKGRRSIKISFADEEIAEALGLSRGTPVIESEMCVFDMSGEPIHTVKDWVRGDNDRYIRWYV